MAYEKNIFGFLSTLGVSEGDVISFDFDGELHGGENVSEDQRKTSKHYENAVLLPTLSDKAGILFVKFSSGYNAGLPFLKISNMKKTGERKLSSIPKLEITQDENLPKISIIATGGTIATHVDYATGGVFMCRTPEEVLSTTPELQDVVSIKSLSSPCLIASEDMNSEHWIAIAKECEKQLNDSENTGIVITHGTDILHYTSAALSFMLPNLNKPIALVGAQRSPDRASFDGSLNLVCASHFASRSPFAEVAIVMHADSSDTSCFAHRGTKVRKMHTSKRDAFQSISDSPLARIFQDGKTEIMNENYRKRNDSKVFADAVFEKNVAILKIHPDANPELLDFLVQKGYKGIVLEGTGLGHVPTVAEGASDFSYGKTSWIPAIREAVKKGVVVAVTSQCLYGSTHETVYRNLRLLKSAGAIFCRDMLPETAFVKLGWLLGHKEYSKEKVAELMRKNLVGEINERILF